MVYRSRLALPFILMVASAVAAQTDLEAQPQDLRECYLKAMQRTSADVIYLSREICDSIFKPNRRSVIVLDPNTRLCTEQWFDTNGRFESADQYCAFEHVGANQWVYACESKTASTGKFTALRVEDHGDTYTRVEQPIGQDPGQLFKSLAACVRYKAGR